MDLRKLKKIFQSGCSKILTPNSYNENNEFIGIVSEIRNYGANDTLVIKNKTSQLLIPYVKDIFIKKVDLVKGFLIVDWDKDEL